MKRALFAIIALVTTAACRQTDSTTNGNTLYVTITPLKGIIETITCNDFTVKTLVPQGASPETFEPSAKQLTEMECAPLIFEVGLINFEQSLTKSIDAEKIVDLSSGLELIEGSCSHAGHHHSHGIDPHIWTSPRALMLMTATAREAIMVKYPDSTKYRTAANALIERIATLDKYCSTRIKEANIKTILIYHPAYTYYAHDYGIEQIAIEQDGKEPTPRQLTALSERAKAAKCHSILIQPQYNADKVRPIANAIDAEIVTTDPLSEDILSEIRRITDVICSDNE